MTGGANVIKACANNESVLFSHVRTFFSPADFFPVYLFHNQNTIWMNYWKKNSAATKFRLKFSLSFSLNKE